ncbi:L-histidine N(alpha)-methyltransferase [Methylophaga pinxianii]|uniref:L-histidine N(alpha)-methyltransferase n=1 Tax=Methylophaga pinxianii TaxID=2881052 RepID=UPI001CF51919|nr:L-histidine N(alpha)-methyltransferase [Methylophaga pinxianii]MCB2427656.1 L-histidine N(alpha)-methyltransferase [Methylophaga pinxianii]UPH46645.1 L-histidine N(alpha)-methyltransferase [Methylophaga pinxianii]
MTYLVLDSLRHQTEDALNEQFAFDVLMGFSAPAKYLPSKYFYDAKGSRLFEQITELEEYYPTRCEFEILNRVGGELAEFLEDEPFEIVELGAGDGRKTKVLLTQLLETTKQFSYIPIDICETAIANLVESLNQSHPSLTTHGIVGDYFASIRHLENTSDSRKLVLLLGSNIGNFDFPSAKRFLHSIWKCLNHNDLFLIGFDLKKDIEVLTKAYNDKRGVTRDFNLNVLTRINNELAGDFDVSRFSHHGMYNPRHGAMESYLISLEHQEVHIGALEKTFEFKPYEAIHLELSHKYLLSDMQQLADQTGFTVLNNWQDSQGYFADGLWRVNKDFPES